MQTAIQDTKALVVVSQDQMLEKLQKSEAMLDDINRGLNDYLEKKRLFFPRYIYIYIYIHSEMVLSLSHKFVRSTEDD